MLFAIDKQTAKYGSTNNWFYLNQRLTKNFGLKEFGLFLWFNHKSG